MENNRKDEVYSNVVRAGKRTYFFDVKETKGRDLYITITESKKVYNEDGSEYYQKHKIFLYKEDFEKFQNGLADVIEKIAELRATGNYKPDNDFTSNSTKETKEDEVDFDNL